MIFKERPAPTDLLKMEALVRRLPLPHPQLEDILKQLAYRKKGYRGECQTDYYLESSLAADSLLLHDIRLITEQGAYFQIDSLLLTPQFFVLIETKNLSGTLTFDFKLQQLTRKFNEIEDGFIDPISQVERQQNHFISWLKKHRFPIPQIFPLVVISFPSSTIKFHNHSSADYLKICHGHALLNRIEYFQNRIPSTASKIELKQLKKIARTIVKHHDPRQMDVLNHFGISFSDLTRGAFCKSCQCSLLIRKHGSWYCSECKVKDKNAHVNALNDFKLLMSNEISTKQCSWWLKINSMRITRDILKVVAVKAHGKTKGAMYILK